VGPPFSSVLAELVDIDFPFVILTGAFRSVLLLIVFFAENKQNQAKVAVGITWIFGMMIKYNFALHGEICLQ
jgi:hypothetical protein